MRIVISDCTHDTLEPETKVFAAAGMNFSLLQCKTEEDLIRDCKNVDIIITQNGPFSRRVIEALKPDLKQVIRYGVGVNTIDLDAATECGVQICNVPDYGVNEVTDHALALMMALARKIVLLNNLTKAGEWDYRKSIPLFRLSGQTVGVIGLGRNGRMFATKAAALGCRVLGHDAYYIPDSKYDEIITLSPLETLFREADFLVLNCPLTDSTRDMISDEVFDKMKSTAYIINTSRGGIINEAALDRALTQGKIAGAGLDVTDVEPLPVTSPLYRHSNCLITPHMAWYSEEASAELKRKVAEEAVRFARGKKCHNPVNVLL